MESRTAAKVVLNSNDRYCFAIAKSLSPDYLWLADSFGGFFYVAWKKLKDAHATSNGEQPLGDLGLLVKSAVGAFNKVNSFAPLSFTELRGAYDISQGAILLGTVVRRGALTGDMLMDAVLIKNNGKRTEYITDSEGTIVKRFVYRAVGYDANAALKLPNTGLFASGIKDNKVTVKTGGLVYKKADAVKGKKGVTTSKSEHIMGWKPSVYLSFTTLSSGAKNPDNEVFGDVSVQIDLKVLKDRGIPFTYYGSGEGIRLIAIEIKGQKGASAQAIEDIVRTKEILVEAWVPPEAVCQIKQRDDVIWSRPV